MTVAVFLDRDGVINVDKHYVHTIDEFEFIEHAVDAMRLMKQKGYELIVVTNQAGIAKGLYTEQEFLDFTQWFDWSLIDQGVQLDDILYCPHHIDAVVEKYKCDCDCRKPKPGMILDAAKTHNIDLAKSYLVGDRVSDILAGIAAGIPNNYLVRSGKTLTAEAEAKATKIYNDLYEVALSLPQLSENVRAHDVDWISVEAEDEEGSQQKSHQAKSSHKDKSAHREHYHHDDEKSTHKKSAYGQHHDFAQKGKHNHGEHQKFAESATADKQSSKGLKHSDKRSKVTSNGKSSTRKAEFKPKQTSVWGTGHRHDDGDMPVRRKKETASSTNNVDD